MIDNHTILTPERAYAVEEFDGELLLYNPAKTRSIYLNGSASLLWQLCDGERDVAAIKTLLIEAYPEAADTIDSDVDAALQRFIEHGALNLDPAVDRVAP